MIGTHEDDNLTMCYALQQNTLLQYGMQVCTAKIKLNGTKGLHLLENYCELGQIAKNGQ